MINALEAEIYALEIDNLLGAYEYSIQVKANAVIGRAMEAVDELVATGNPITAKDLERVTAPINDLIRNELGLAMEQTQASFREMAARRGDVTPQAPMLTAGGLLQQAVMEDDSIAEWTRRRSPSKWMQGLMDEIQKGIEAGWDRHRSTTEQASKRLAATVIETGLWSHANQTMFRNWTAREFIHRTRRDELVCDRCGPRDGQVFSGASNGPPVHPRCRCIAVPVQTG